MQIREPAMNKLLIEKQILIFQSLVGGNSIHSIERISGVHSDTIKLKFNILYVLLFFMI